MTSEQYIVKNCPAYRAGMNLPHYCKAVGCCINTYVDGMDCTTVTNCVIKQVIELCKKEAVINYPKKEKEFITVNGYQAILNMFDIEEINK